MGGGEKEAILPKAESGAAGREPRRRWLGTGAPFRKDACPPFLGKAALAPGGFSPAGPQKVDPRRDLLPSEGWPRPGELPEAWHGDRENRSALTGPGGLPLGHLPAGGGGRVGGSCKFPPGAGAWRLDGGVAGASEADGATWWLCACRNPHHHGDRLVLRDPAPPQASGPPTACGWCA